MRIFSVRLFPLILNCGMNVTINDIPVELNNSTPTLEDVVLYSGVKDFKGLAVAVNNSIVPKTKWNTAQLNENDNITIIRATQGG
jgi:sulfur carrier protein